MASAYVSSCFSVLVYSVYSKDIWSRIDGQDERKQFGATRINLCKGSSCAAQRKCLTISKVFIAYMTEGYYIRKVSKCAKQTWKEKLQIRNYYNAAKASVERLKKVPDSWKTLPTTQYVESLKNGWVDKSGTEKSKQKRVKRVSCFPEIITCGDNGDEKWFTAGKVFAEIS